MGGSAFANTSAAGKSQTIPKTFSIGEQPHPLTLLLKRYHLHIESVFLEYGSEDCQPRGMLSGKTGAPISSLSNRATLGSTKAVPKGFSISFPLNCPRMLQRFLFHKKSMNPVVHLRDRDHTAFHKWARLESSLSPENLVDDREINDSVFVVLVPSGCTIDGAKVQGLTV